MCLNNGLLDNIFSENFNIDIISFQNYIEYIYSDEFKNHEYFLLINKIKFLVQIHLIFFEQH